MDEPVKSISFDFIRNQGLECSSTEVSEITQELTGDDVEDGSKLAVFFGMTDQTFMCQLLNPDSTLSTCVDFLYKAKAEGFNAFRNIYKICHEIGDDVYGSHFLIALKSPNSYRVIINMNKIKIKNWDFEMLKVALKGNGSHIYLGRKQVDEKLAKSDQQMFTMAFSMVAHYSSWLVQYLDEQMKMFNAEYSKHGDQKHKNVLLAIDNLKKEIPKIRLTDATKETLTQKLIWLDYFLYRYLLEVHHAVQLHSESEMFLKFVENHIKKHNHKSADKLHGYIEGDEKLTLTLENAEPQLEIKNMKYDVKILISNTKLLPLQTTNMGATFNYITGWIYDLITSIMPILVDIPKIRDATTTKKSLSFVTTKSSVYLQSCLCSKDRKVSWLCPGCRTLILSTSINGTVSCSCRKYAAGTLYCSAECNV